MDVYDRIMCAVSLLNGKLRRCFEAAEKQDLLLINEIRLRADRYITVSTPDGERFITSDGKLAAFRRNAVSVSQTDIEGIFMSALRYSIHSHSREIAQGFITLKGGNRLGFCGTAVYKSSADQQVEYVNKVSSVNIRISREIIGCANEILNSESLDTIKGLLIAGPPLSGKTTVLRDLCRQLGDVYRVSLIDERGELAAVFDGTAQNDVGMFTDVFNYYTRYDGIITAVRTMSPNILICDEIGSEDDVKALEYAENSGVKVIATTHAESIDDAINKRNISKLISRHIFDRAVMLGTNQNIGRIMQMRRLEQQ